MSNTTKKSTGTGDADKEKKGRERRDCFRVNHDIIFDYKVIDAFSAENNPIEDEFKDSNAVNLINELRVLDKGSDQTLRLLMENNRLVGEYLQTLNNKIDLIARHSLFAQDAFAQSKAKTRINLSEEGIAFVSDRALYKGNYLAMRLVFLPTYIPVLSYAKVVRCEPKEEKYQIAAKFFRLQDKERKEIARQILKAQVRVKKIRVKEPRK